MAMTKPEDAQEIEPDEEILELTGAEHGRYRVYTQRSSHLIDLVDGTVTREPGPGAKPTVNDRPRPLRSLERCRVGVAGYWTMIPDPPEADSIEYRWHVSSTIRRIERLDDSPVVEDGRLGQGEDNAQ